MASVCGIVGVYRRDGRPVAEAELKALRDTMTHRGPDDDGLWLRETFPDVGFGHRRLSIVDLSRAGRQPMRNEDGSVFVTFNGENVLVWTRSQLATRSRRPERLACL